MTLHQHFALEKKTRQKLLQNDPPPTQLSHVVSQLRAELCALQHVVQQLAELQSVACSKKRDNVELGENSAHNKTNNNDNDNDNNNNDHNKNSQESGLNSLDLDNDNPESEPDLDRTSSVSFTPAMGQVESGLRSLDQQEADLSLDNLGHQLMTIGSSLGSLDQHQQEEQEGKTARMSFGKTRPKKRVTFSKATLAAYNEKKQNKENRCCKTTLACWNNFQQASHNTQEAWRNEPSKMQQQSATALAKELEHRPCNNNSLDREEQTLGHLESQTQTQQACRSPKHNSNTSSLGIGSKNIAAWGIMIDTGAAISLAPMSFAPGVELSPVESTLQLRTVTGKAIAAFGRRTVQLIGSELSFSVSFVIADVEHALIGMDIFMAEQLSMVIGSLNEHYLVNKAGAQTQLQQRGHHLYIEACPCELGLSTCMRSSLPEEIGSLLDDKVRAQEGAVSSSGGSLWNQLLP